MRLFDAGTTAEYYATFLGFRRCASRREFVDRWRAHRTCALAQPEALHEACDDVRGLFNSYLREQTSECAAGAASGATAGALASVARAAPTLRPQKQTVRIEGLPPPCLEEATIRAALTGVLPASAASAIQRVTIVAPLGAAFVTFGDAAAAAATLTLDGSALPCGPPGCAGTSTPVVHVTAHGRKVKRARSDARPRPVLQFAPSGPDTVALELMFA